MAEAGDMKQRLEAYLKARFPQRQELSVVEMVRMSVGVSYETYILTVIWKEASGPVSEGLVIRMEPEYGCVPPYDVRPQYEVLKRLHGTDIPVPKVYWLEMDRKVLGRPFFVMEKMNGEVFDTYYPNLLQELAQLRKEFAGMLAKIHGLDWQALGLSVLGVPENDRHYAEKEIARWEWVVRDTQYSPQPVMAELFSWLKRNIPRPDRITLCHGDVKVGNFLARNGRIVGALDWEMVAIGDPLSDVGWSCMMNVRSSMFLTRDGLIRDYEEMAGVKVNKKSLFFWEVFSNVKLAAIGFAGVKSSLESKGPGVRLMGMTMRLPRLQDTAAQMLGF